MNPELRPSRIVITCDWDEVPHLTDAQKATILASTPPYQRDARSKGIPSLGAGAIYPIPESDVKVKDFELPPHWPRGYGMDVGWNRTAVVWSALDRETGTRYLYSEHYRGEAEPTVHSAAIRARGPWIPGRIDPAARGRSQEDGKMLIETYRQQGLLLDEADHAVEAGLLECWTVLSVGKLKVFASLQHWFEEFRLYRRDEKGAIVKKHDHLMDATRYLILSGVSWMRSAPVKKDRPLVILTDDRNYTTGWMAR